MSRSHDLPESAAHRLALIGVTVHCVADILCR
ncbi:Ms4533A family Cys-rich leader peptide [uncultured Streptomyces sp.]